LQAFLVVSLPRDFGQLLAVEREERLIGKRSVIAAEFVGIDLHRLIISSIGGRSRARTADLLLVRQAL
jgi:hypothetical protein